MKKFLIITFFVVVVFAVYSFLFNFSKKENLTEQTSETISDYKGEIQEITVKVDGTKYPAYFPGKTVVKKGVPVRLTFVTENEQSCALAINIPEAGIKNKILSETGRESVEFTPKKEGDLKIFCGMNGMFSTIISVIA